MNVSFEDMMRTFSPKDQEEIRRGGILLIKQENQRLKEQKEAQARLERSSYKRKLTYSA